MYYGNKYLTLVVFLALLFTPAALAIENETISKNTTDPKNMTASENLTVSGGEKAPAGNSGKELFADMEEGIDIYNQNIETAPDALKSMARNERILFDITLEDETKLYIWGTVGNNASFDEFEMIKDPSEKDPTLKVLSDEATVRSIMDSSDPVNDFFDALDENRIIIDTVDVGIVKEIVFFAMKNGLGKIVDLIF